VHGLLIAIEGVDGAGKRTLCDGLRAAFESNHRSVATLSFPRYGHSIAADLAAEALHGEHGDLASSVYGMAVLFALDRAGAHDEIGHLRAAYDVLILDRYVASNAAYSAARLHQDADGEAVEWVRILEFERLHMPPPDWQVLLDVPPALASDRARHREQNDAARRRDVYERDDELQRRTGDVYAGLATAGFGGDWRIAYPDVDPVALAGELGSVS
jgi:dTMP kinase